MTHEGRMARGKANHEKGILKDNADTLYYLSQSKNETDVDYSSMTKKQLIEQAEGLELTGNETKDDLIVLLENQSDEVVESE